MSPRTQNLLSLAVLGAALAISVVPEYGAGKVVEGKAAPDSGYRVASTQAGPAISPLR